ncbi:MAG: hypothetical protein NDJ72_04760 [Elusimicrobia bacterium]|nr:hypothetical protein [Elusimicrobiota bacterium]
MDQQPKIPTLKDAQKPQVKIKGMGAGLTLFDRLKQFKKKDLAFILAGLGTLFMAPLAEHFMMAPENGDASLQQGWGKGGTGSNLFGSGSSPYESGNNNIASGGAIGGGGDIITPLNVRDPSALVMGPGSAQQPPAGSAAPAAPPPAAPASSETDYRDALKGAASRAASAAVKKAPLPVPKIAVGGSGLRGLGAAGGGTSASASLGPINSGNLGQAGTGGGGLGMVRTAPGFRGVAGARSPTGGTGLDNTKRAGANAGDAFNRAGSAAAGLNAAASEAIPTAGQGYGGGGAGGSGANDKPGSGTGPGGSKSVGESLAFIAAKERMMENMKLEFEKRKLKDPELLLYGIRNDILKASAAKIGEGLTSWGMCKGLSMGCPPPDDDLVCDGFSGKASQLTMCEASKDPKVQPSLCWAPLGSGGYEERSADGKATGRRCNPSGKGKDGAGNPSSEGNGMSELNGAIGSVCEKIRGTSGGKDSGYDSYYPTMHTAAKNTEIARNTLMSGGNTRCATEPVKGDTASKMLSDAKAKLLTAAAAAGADGKTPAATDAIGLIKAGSTKSDDADAKAAAKALVDAAALIKSAEGRITEAETTLGTPLTAPVKSGPDVDTFKRVTEQFEKVQTAQTQAKDVITSLRTAASNLTVGIASIEPLVKGAEKPVGALPDQNSLNKASEDLVKEAGVDPPAKSVVKMPEVKGDVVKEQTPALKSLTDLQGAIDKAATTDAAAKAKPDDKPAQDAAAEAKKDLTAKLEAAKTSVATSQTALTTAATSKESPIRTTSIRGGALP